VADLETPDPQPVAETPPAAPETPPDPTEAEPDGTIDTAGQKMVPLGALVDERRKGQALKQKADQFDQVAGYVNQVRPYIEFLQANPGLMTRTQQETRPTPVTTTQPQDEKAEALARTLDLYTSDSQPDVKRARTILGIIDDAAETKATAKVKPLEESTTRERSQFNFQRAMVTKAPDGRSVPKEMLEAIWSRTDPKITSTEEGAAGVVAMALGLSVLQGHSHQPTAQTPLAPPLHTEPPGSRTMKAPVLSSLDEGIAKLRGMDTKTYAERTKGFQRGGPNVLED